MRALLWLAVMCSGVYLTLVGTGVLGRPDGEDRAAVRSPSQDVRRPVKQGSPVNAAVKFFGDRFAGSYLSSSGDVHVLVAFHRLGVVVVELARVTFGTFLDLIDAAAEGAF